MNQQKERQPLIALLPKRFKFNQNDPLLKKFQNLSMTKEKIYESEAIQNIKKQQEVQLKKLIILRKRSKSSLQNAVNMDEQNGNNVKEQKDSFRMINLSGVDKKKYKIIHKKGDLLNDQFRNHSFNLEQVQYQTLGDEDTPQIKNTDQPILQNGGNPQQQQDDDRKKEFNNLINLRKRRQLMNLQLNPKQVFDNQFFVFSKTANNASIQLSPQVEQTSPQSCIKVHTFLSQNQSNYHTPQEQQQQSTYNNFYSLSSQIPYKNQTNTYFSKQNNNISNNYSYISNNQDNTKNIYCSSLNKSEESRLTDQFINQSRCFQSQKSKRNQSNSIQNNDSSLNDTKTQDILNISSYLTNSTTPTNQNKSKINNSNKINNNSNISQNNSNISQNNSYISQNNSNISQTNSNKANNPSNNNNNSNSKNRSNQTPKMSNTYVQQFYGNPICQLPQDLYEENNMNRNIRQQERMNSQESRRRKRNSNSQNTTTNQNNNTNNNNNNPKGNVSFQEMNNPQIIFKKKKETMNKILGLLTKDKQQNQQTNLYYQQMINKNKEILLTGHHINSFNHAYQSHLTTHSPLHYSNTFQSNQFSLSNPYNQSEFSQSNNNSNQDYNNNNNQEQQEEELFNVFNEKGKDGQSIPIENISQKIVLSPILYEKPRQIKDINQEKYDNFLSCISSKFQSSQNTFYPYKQMFDEDDKDYQKTDLISIHKVSIQPRINLKNQFLSRPLSTQSSPQNNYIDGNSNNNMNSTLMQGMSPTASPFRYSTPKNNFIRKNLHTPNSQRGQFDCSQTQARNKSNQGQRNAQQSENNNNKKIVIDRIIESDEIERWNVNDNYESMSPLIDKNDIFFP